MKQSSFRSNQTRKDIKIYGCFFHFKQAIHRWVTKHGYKLILNRNAQFRIWVNMLCSLALVPLDLVDSCLAIVEEKALNFNKKKKEENERRINNNNKLIK